MPPQLFKSVVLIPILHLCLILLCNQCLVAQAPNIQWQKSIGGTDVEAASQVLQTSDGGSIVVGSTKSINTNIQNHGAWDIYVVKLDNLGNTIWQKCYGGTRNEIGLTIAKTTDGGYVIGGQTNSNDGDIIGNTFGAVNDHGWIVKINSVGTILWQKFINGGIIGSAIKSIIQTNDGGFLFAGNAYAAMPTLSYDDAWAGKLSASGNLEWSRVYGGNYHDGFNVVSKTTDGGYILAGQSASNDLAGYHQATTGITFDFYVVKIDANGNQQWQKLYGGSEGELANAVIETGDGGFAIAGYNGGNSGDVSGNKGFDDAWLIKINNAGTLLWQKSYGGTTNDQANDLIENSDGSIAIACMSGSINGDVTNFINIADYWIVKINGSNGNIIWQKKYGGTGSDVAKSLVLTPDGGIIVAGDAEFTGGDVTINNGNADYWVVKLVGITTNVNTVPSDKTKINIFPNPTNSVIKLDGIDPIDNWQLLKIFDINGKIVFQNNQVKNKTNLQIDISFLPKGSYTIKLINDKGNFFVNKILKP